MSSAPTSEELSPDATWLAQALDPRQRLVRVIAMDPAAYREEAFLDDRMLAKGRANFVIPWAEAERAVAGEFRSDARWIFHIGHVGSTLVARLLGEIGGALSVREPRILRDVAMLGAAERAPFVEPVRKLLSRTFAADEVALVKATSFVSEIAPELVPPGERALFLYATPRNYIGSILAGENSLKELSALAPFRSERLSKRAHVPEPRTPAEAAAIAWACEMIALEAAAEAMPDRRVDWADFDAMLADMAAGLGRVADAFGFATGNVPAIASGPLMGRYSKALEYAYTPALRSDLIAEAQADNRADIDSAVAMLQSAAENAPLLARALARAKES